MRIRGELVAYIDGLQAPPALVDCAVGVHIVPGGSGTTVTAAPITDPNAPWLLYERFTLGYEEYVTDVIDNPGLTMFRKVIDVKGMRIIRPDVEMQVVFQNATLAGAASVNFSLAARVLFGS